jgi:hypothetical protein
MRHSLKLTYAGLFAVVALILFNLGNENGLFIQKYLGDDPLFYLVIANNIATSGFSSFDGIHFTNGYHPLWQIVVTVLAIFLPAGPPLLLTVVTTGILLAVLTFFLIDYFHRTENISSEALSLAGVLAIFFVVMPSWYALESFLSTCLFLCALIYYLRTNQNAEGKVALIQGLLFSAVVLSRLDTVFIVGPLLAFQVFTQRKISALCVRRLLFQALGLFAPLSIYLLFNEVNSGHIMPISGAIKSSFPNWTQTNMPLDPARLSRILPAILSATVVTIILLYSIFSSKERYRYDVEFLAMNLGVVLFSIYEFGFQKDASWGVQPWHFAIPNVVMLLSLPQIVFRMLNKTLLTLTSLCVLVGVLFLASSKYGASEPQNPIIVDLYATAMWINTHVEEGEVIAATDPGVVAYFGERRTVNLDGLVNSYEYQELIRNHELEEYLERNSVRYVAIFGERKIMPVTEVFIPARLYGVAERLSFSRANLVYQSPNRFYAIWKR